MAKNINKFPVVQNSMLKRNFELASAQNVNFPVIKDDKNSNP